MITSDDIDQIAPALSLAQAEMPKLFRDSTNPHFRSAYATLEAVVDSVFPAFHKHEITVLQAGETREGEFGVTTRLLHKSGQWFEVFTPMYPVKKDPQGIGSAITYGRRYALMAIAGVAPEDDDGNASSTAPLDKKTVPGITQAQAQQIAEIGDHLGFDKARCEAAYFWASNGETKVLLELNTDEANRLIKRMQKDMVDPQSTNA